ncbi:unnamed protein product [Acanthoscelides obtectus]|uniref:Uncharacterized protein n=1 Tax=Acanthoscelides obtectus TaxID=200917 RepID=A0A9P0LX83_ACAOB|nr:unnamed protein product [Acanthoscelides obtectus]CAK1648532.1 hypothetical protein AOBTE_LOCUS15747 [Acanthoscelides obtectus]
MYEKYRMHPEIFFEYTRMSIGTFEHSTRIGKKSMLMEF